MKKDDFFRLLTEACPASVNTAEGSFAGDLLRACADAMAELWSTEIDGLERRAFVATATGEWLTRVCADRGVERREDEDDDTLRRRALQLLASQPASGNAAHYAAWCAEVDDILRVRVLPMARGVGTVDIIAVDRDGKAPAPTALAEAQAVVDAERPIGVDACIRAAEETALDISAAVVLQENTDLRAVEAEFAAALAEFCRENALLTTVISYAKVLRLLLDTSGVADVRAFTLCGGEESLTLSQTVTAVVGSVTLTEADA